MRQVAGEGAEASAVRRLENLISNGIETRELLLRRDAVYEVTFRHLSSTEDTPDYDYSLALDFPVTAVGTTVICEDPDALLGQHSSEEVATANTFSEKKIMVYCLAPTLTPDYDRDRQFDAQDEALSAQGKALPVWVNADDDRDADNGVNVGWDGTYGERSAVGETPLRDGDNSVVDGKSDLEDFFPVRFRLGAALRTFVENHAGAEVRVAARKAGAAEGDDYLHVLWCGGGMDEVERFHEPGEGEACYGPKLDEACWEATVAMLVDYPLEDTRRMPPQLVARLCAGDASETPLFVEACDEGDLTLAVTLFDGGMKGLDDGGKELTTCRFESRLPEDRYATLNLREEVAETRPSPATTAANGETTVYFVHGYNVSEEEAAEWFNTLYKRLWQSGMNARFCGVTWQGDEQGSLPDYYKNVENAFVAAGRLADELKKRPGRKVVLAHSLGNMAVSAALQDFNAPIDAYFMLNSAVPSEAYDADAPTYDFATNAIPAGLVHDDWRAYPAKSWSALWHRHFLPHDDYIPTEADTARAQLTWKGRFKDVIVGRDADVFNVYSLGEGDESGDEVFELLSETPSPLTGFEWDWGNLFSSVVDMVSGRANKGRYSWQKQETWKGRRNAHTFAFVASDTMGWGFNGGEPSSSAEDAENMSPALCRKLPLFCRVPQDIFSEDADTVRALRTILLARGIPAMSNATGRSKLAAASEMVQYDLQEQCIDSQGSNFRWARLSGDLRERWLHSDIKDVGYLFVKPLFEFIVQQGRLK